MMRTALACTLLWLLLVSPAQAELRVFEVSHAPAESLLPAVEQALGPYDSVSVYRNSLVVNAEAGTLARIEELLAHLDTPLRNLLISVRRVGAALGESGSTSVEGTLHSGDTSISTRRQNGDGRSEVQISTTRSSGTRERNAGQSVRALEGRPVLVSAGQLVPLADTGWRGPGVSYHPVEEGFMITARVTGRDVLLEVSAGGARLEDGTVRGGSLQSSVSGPLGEWIPLGGTSSSTQSSSSGLLAGAQTRTRDAESIEVRVELLD